jgi:uncharacterized protein (TIGR02118 family)
MVKLIILYKQPANHTSFEERYIANLALMEQLPGIVRRQACTVLGGPGGASPYHRLLELYFENAEALDLALRSDLGKRAGQDLMSFAREAELVFADVFED